MQTFIDRDLLDRLRVGPLASYLDAYLKRIEQVLLSSSVQMQMYAIARFSNWLRAGHGDLHQADEATVSDFCAAIRAFSGAAARDWSDGSQAAGTQKLAAAILSMTTGATFCGSAAAHRPAF